MSSSIKFILIVFLFINIFSQNKIYIGIIDQEIDLGLVPYVQRVINEAEENKAKAIIFRINTFGGRVDAATQIKDAILNAKIKTIAFIDKRAISAGALISLSCQRIYMVPGASIGASTVVNQTGEKQSEKYQSYMRSEMRSTAQKNDRPSKIAEAMVDERIIIPGLVDSTQLVTLTTDEAIKYNIADSSAINIAEIIQDERISDSETIYIEQNWAEIIVSFLNNPIISSLLIMIGIIGLFTEIKTPGWGFAGTAGLIALLLFFGSGLILNVASIFEILIFALGIILLLIEIFLIPGFGITGIIGICLVIVSLFLGLISDFPLIDYSIISRAIIQLAVTLVFSLIIIGIIWKFLPESKLFNKFVLSDNINAKTGYAELNERESLINTKGIAFTDLRPSGVALINNKKYDVISEGDYITKNSEISIIRIEGLKIVVKKV